MYGNIYDVLKFVLSLLVVSIHVNPFMGELWYIRYPLARIAVPLFFMMSSYFFFRKIKIQESKQQLLSLKNFIKRNVILYMSWFIVLWPISYDLWGKRFTLLQLCFEIPSRMLLTSTFKSSWYLSALVIGVIIVYFLTKYTNNKVGIVIGLICYLICCMLSNYYLLFKDITFIQTIKEFYAYTICYSFPVGLIFIVMGKILAQEDQIKVTKTTYIQLLISTILLLIETYLVLHNRWYIETPCYIMLIPFCWYFFRCISQINLKVSYGKEIRVISTIMYCFHYSFKIILVDYLKMKGITINMMPYSLYLYLIVVIVSVIVSLIIYKLSQKKHFWLLKNFY